jgi:hypothetical protein
VAAIPPTAWFWPLVACQPASAPAARVQVCKFDQEPLCSCALHSIGNDLIGSHFWSAQCCPKTAGYGADNKAIQQSEMRVSQHANNLQETSFVCSCAVRARLSRARGFKAPRGTNLAGTAFHSGLAWSPACRARCAQTKRPASAHPRCDMLQHTPLRDVRRRTRPLAHRITSAPAPAFHAPMVSARIVLNYTYTYERWRAAAGIARRELLTCGTCPAPSVCCQRWLVGLRSAVQWSSSDDPAATSPLHAAGRGARHDGIRGRAGKTTGWMTGRDRLPALCWCPGHGHQQSTDSKQGEQS